MATQIDTLIADKRAETASLIRRSEDLLVARRPIDYALDADIARCEDELADLLKVRAANTQELQMAA